MQPGKYFDCLRQLVEEALSKRRRLSPDLSRLYEKRNRLWRLQDEARVLLRFPTKPMLEMLKAGVAFSFPFHDLRISAVIYDDGDGWIRATYDGGQELYEKKPIQGSYRIMRAHHRSWIEYQCLLIMTDDAVPDLKEAFFNWQHREAPRVEGRIK